MDEMRIIDYSMLEELLSYESVDPKVRFEINRINAMICNALHSTQIRNGKAPDVPRYFQCRMCMRFVTGLIPVPNKDPVCGDCASVLIESQIPRPVSFEVRIPGRILAKGTAVNHAHAVSIYGTIAMKHGYTHFVFDNSKVGGSYINAKGKVASLVFKEAKKK